MAARRVCDPVRDVRGEKQAEAHARYRVHLP